jgi:hypothetical protein
MPDHALVIHYPDGDFEYVIPPTFAPAVGMTVERRNALWEIIELVDATPREVYLERVEVAQGASTSWGA